MATTSTPIRTVATATTVATAGTTGAENARDHAASLAAEDLELLNISLLMYGQSMKTCERWSFHNRRLRLRIWEVAWRSQQLYLRGYLVQYELVKDYYVFLFLVAFPLLLTMFLAIRRLLNI
jgi:hypothetical protein